MNTGLNLRLIIPYKAIPNYTGKKYIISLEATEAKEINNVNAGQRRTRCGQNDPCRL